MVFITRCWSTVYWLNLLTMMICCDSIMSVSLLIRIVFGASSFRTSTMVLICGDLSRLLGLKNIEWALNRTLVICCWIISIGSGLGVDSILGTCYWMISVSFRLDISSILGICYWMIFISFRLVEGLEIDIFELAEDVNISFTMVSISISML